MIDFTVQTNQRYLEWAELLQLWQRLDRDTRFAGAWLVDHFSPFFIPGRNPVDGPNHESWTALAALAQATERMRIGVLLTCNTHRNPAVLAKMATTVDHISGGRLDFALGTGFNAAEHRAYGLEFPSMSERYERLEEALQIVRRMWTETRPVFRGDHYWVDGPTMNPAPVQRPRPPIYVGGNGERKTLRLVAHHADACNFKLLTSPTESKRLYDVIARHCEDVGRDPNEIRKTVEIAIASDLDDSLLWNYVEHQRDKTCKGMTRDDVRRLVLHGSADSMAALIDQYIEIGTDEIVLYMMDSVDAELLMRFSDDVIARY